MKKTAIYSLFFINLFIILDFWWSSAGFRPDAASIFIAFGKVSGLLAAFFILLQFMLIGRSPWLERVFGLDKLSRLHHLNGYYSIIFILLHPTFLTIGYAISSKVDVISQFMSFITSYEDVLNALIAVLLFITIIFMSIYIVRKRLKYELWYFVHLFTYVAIFLAWGHQLKNGEDFLANKWFVYYWYALYTFVFGSHIIFRFIKPLYMFSKHRFTIQKIVKENGDATSVYITGNNLKNFHIQPGQFMILRFLNKSFWWQAHPFSLSKLPDGNNLRVTMKNVGDFTSQASDLKPGTPLIIDGPYGVFTEKESKKNNILLIAGGIGITPIRSLAEQMLKNGKDVVLLYSNKMKRGIIFNKELDNLAKQYTFPIYYILSQDVTEKKLQGRLDRNKIQTLVKDFKEREIYICGPIAMTNNMKTELIELGVPSTFIHYEKFSL